MTARLAIPAAALALTACGMSSFPNREKQIKPGMSADQVTAVLGRPASIEHSESPDQTSAATFIITRPRTAKAASSSSITPCSRPSFVSKAKA